MFHFLEVIFFFLESYFLLQWISPQNQVNFYYLKEFYKIWKEKLQVTCPEFNFREFGMSAHVTVTSTGPVHIATSTNKTEEISHPLQLHAFINIPVVEQIKQYQLNSLIHPYYNR